MGRASPSDGDLHSSTIRVARIREEALSVRSTTLQADQARPPAVRLGLRLRGRRRPTHADRPPGCGKTHLAQTSRDAQRPVRDRRRTRHRGLYVGKTSNILLTLIQPPLRLKTRRDRHIYIDESTIARRAKPAIPRDVSGRASSSRVKISRPGRQRPAAGGRKHPHQDSSRRHTTCCHRRGAFAGLEGSSSPHCRVARGSAPASARVRAVPDDCSARSYPEDSSVRADPEFIGRSR